MTQENVQVARATMEAFARRDYDGVIARFHGDGEWRPANSPGGLEGTTYVGHEGVRSWAAQLEESWEKFDVVDCTFETVGDRVLVLGQVRVRGSTSGVEFDAPLAQVWEIDEGKVRRLTGYSTPADARKAVGLSE